MVGFNRQETFLLNDGTLLKYIHVQDTQGGEMKTYIHMDSNGVFLEFFTDRDVFRGNLNLEALKKLIKKGV